MSIASINNKVRLEVWLKAGGRCEYPGCNKALWRDDLTLRKMNTAYLAHIVADSEDGPRGDKVLSEKLKSDFSNILLLCDVHHRLIDREGLVDHSVDLLRSFKVAHEVRIERLTAIQASRKTEVLIFATRIRDRPAFPTFEQVQTAVSPERYPATERGLSIELSDLEIDEQDPEFWEVAKKATMRRLAGLLADGEGPTGHPLSHLSIFAIAPIPLLIYFGKQLGDVIPADVYQRNRQFEGWSWRALGDEGFKYTLLTPEPGQASSSSVASAPVTQRHRSSSRGGCGDRDEVANLYTHDF